MRSHRWLLLLQLAGTLAVLGCGAPNALKALILPCWWLVTFQNITLSEAVLYALVCAIFTVMDVLSVRQGLFAFERPDVAGLAYYEPLMWGFYVIHTMRMLDRTAPRPSPIHPLFLLVPFAAAFSLISQSYLLLVVTAGILGLGLALFRERGDFIFVLYMILLGGAVEFTGVWFGQWRYPGSPAGGVPIWFVTLWGGVGLFVHRLVLPLTGWMRERLQLVACLNPVRIR